MRLSYPILSNHMTTSNQVHVNTRLMLTTDHVCCKKHAMPGPPPGRCHTVLLSRRASVVDGCILLSTSPRAHVGSLALHVTSKRVAAGFPLTSPCGPASPHQHQLCSLFTSRELFLLCTHFRHPNRLYCLACAPARTLPRQPHQGTTWPAFQRSGV